MSAAVSLVGLAISRLTEDQVVAHVLGQLRAGHGGRLDTLNIDICRLVRRDPAVQRLFGDASLIVPDGMPVVWAAWLRGTPLTERVTGASLILSLSEAAAREGRSVYLLGGAPMVAEQAAMALRSRHPDLRVVGTHAPPVGFDATPLGIEAVRDRLTSAGPDIVYVGLGTPKQELLIAQLAPALPAAWFIACGAAIPFAAGVLRRAPGWMQHVGLEWLFRLLSEPRRLYRRYLIDDLPFAAMLLASCAAQRVSGQRFHAGNVLATDPGYEPGAGGPIAVSRQLDRSARSRSPRRSWRQDADTTPPQPLEAPPSAVKPA